MSDKPKYRQTDIASVVRKADPGPSHYPTYRFTNRTFTKKDQPGPRPA